MAISFEQNWGFVLKSVDETDRKGEKDGEKRKENGESEPFVPHHHKENIYFGNICMNVSLKDK